MEAIFLVLDERRPSPQCEPPADIAGKARILGDIIAPVSDPDDWDALRNSRGDRSALEGRQTDRRRA